MNDLDDILQADLGALRADTARALPSFEWTVARLGAGAGPYRDDQPGAEARRKAVHARWLRDLALMPLASERIFVHRVSRAAAGATALVAAAFALLASLDVWMQQLVLMLIGRPTAPLIAALLGGSVLAAYVFAGLAAERYYERHLRRQLEDADDPAVDPREASERLALAPENHARALLDRVDAAAVALPLAGMVSGGLLIGLLFFFSDPGYSALLLVDAARPFLVHALIIGGIAAVGVGMACQRDRRALERSQLLVVAEHWLTLAAGITVALAALWYAARVAFGLHAWGVIPNVGTARTLAALGLVALVVPTTWVLLRMRRREQRRIGAHEG